MVVAFAGRRIDPPDADPPRFPPENEALVASRVRRLLEELHPSALVASAACGADVLALEAADRLEIDYVVVLPWPEDRFRQRSVVDRGGGWGTRFDRIVDDARSRGALRVLGLPDEGEAAFEATNQAILDQAAELTRRSDKGEPVVAVVAWDGQPRGAGDITEQFIKAARARAIKVVEIATR